MLDAELPRCARAAERDGVRAVSGERDPLSAGLVRDRAMQIARKPRVHLDEVGALLLGLAYRLSRLSLGGDFDEQRGISDGGSAIDDVAGDDRPRSEQLAALDLGAPAVQQRGAGHLPDRGDAVGQVERRRDLLRGNAVHVGVDKPGDHVLARQIEDLDTGRHREACPAV